MTEVRTAWPMRPRPAARARSQRGRGRPYKPQEVLEAQAHVALLHERFRGTYPRGTPVAVELLFLCHQWRGDPDNLAKLVMDALQVGKLGRTRATTGNPASDIYGAGVYHNDRQVRRIVAEWWQVGKAQPEGVRLHMHLWHPPEEGVR